MNVTISSVKFKADKKLEDFITDKILKLENLYDGVMAGDITLKLDHSSSDENKITEIKILLPGEDLFAKKQCKTFEEATDLAVDALKKQLIKRKEKIRSK